MAGGPCIHLHFIGCEQHQSNDFGRFRHGSARTFIARSSPHHGFAARLAGNRRRGYKPPRSWWRRSRVLPGVSTKVMNASRAYIFDPQT
jgi:hypothetical protein